MERDDGLVKDENVVSVGMCLIGPGNAWKGERRAVEEQEKVKEMTSILKLEFYLYYKFEFVEN